MNLSLAAPEIHLSVSKTKKKEQSIRRKGNKNEHMRFHYVFIVQFYFF